MTTVALKALEPDTGFAGLCLTAEEYYALPDDGRRYELVHGVLVMSPSATPRHQLVSAAVFKQLDRYVDSNELGLVLYETDVQLPRGKQEPAIVYRPEIVYIRADRVAGIGKRIEFTPDVVVEVISPYSRNFDSVTKFEDYEKAGVREYWLIDPEKQRMTFFGLSGERFVEIPHSDQSFESKAVPGFRMDLFKIREAFGRLG